ncbi:MAG TPA: DinB family protein [Bryobacteraceae bacterium]|nr:DinB family protein [Bryobacteraceae bacterium]
MAKELKSSLRGHLMNLLRMKGAHLSFQEAVKDFPEELRGRKPEGAPHTAWQLLEHLRIAQEDILDFSRNKDYQAKKWPDDYWPKDEAPPSAEAWDESVKQFERDLKTMEALTNDTKHDLLAEIAHGKGQTLLREALLMADHNSYHLGQLVYLRKTLEGSGIKSKTQ